MVGPEMRDAKPGEYFHVMNGQDMIGGIAGPAQRNPNAPPHWLIYFEAAGCKAATDKAKSLGGRAYVENMKIGESGYSSVIADPQGATFGLHSRHA
jgi:predicted enzyme related to lactoylglutathione lyase